MRNHTYRRDASYPPYSKRKSWERSNSFLALDEELFKPVAFAGSGSYAAVRLFANQTGEKIAVRSPIIEHSTFSQAHRYGRFLDKAHGHYSACLIYWNNDNNMHIANIIDRPNPSHLPPDDEVLDWRLIMSELSGKQLFTFLQEEKQNSRLQFFCLHQAAMLIHQLHQKNIVHGDIHLGNFLVIYEDGGRSLTVTDFDFSSDLNEPVELFCMSKTQNSHIPPEKRYEEENEPPVVLSDIRHDVYSFAYMLRSFVRLMHITTPELEELIHQGLDPDINKRPENMHVFIDTLAEEAKKSYKQVRYCYWLQKLNYPNLAKLVSASEANFEHIQTAIENVHTALLNAQTSLFKSNGLSNFLQEENRDMVLGKIIYYAHSHPESRIAKTLEIIEHCNLDIQSTRVIQDIHLEAFRRSTGIAKTKAYGPETFYSYTSACAAAKKYPLTIEKIREIKQRDPSCRLSQIAKTVGFDEPIPLVHLSL